MILYFEAEKLNNFVAVSINFLLSSAVTFTHGISIGHITQADIGKSLFRENIVSRSSFYNFQFNGQDG